MNHRRRGKNFEYAVRDDRAASGATLVMLSSGSHGPVDVLAAFPDRLELIQCKIDPKRMTRADKMVLKDLACETPSGVAILAHRGSNGRGIFYEVITKRAA